MKRQSQIGHSTKQKLVMRDANSNPLWTDSATAKHIVHPAECRAQQQMKLSHCCSTVQVNKDTFYCVDSPSWSADQLEEKEEAPWMPQCNENKTTEAEKQRQRKLARDVPRYCSVWVIKVIEQDSVHFIVCPCNYFKRFGILCPHVGSVLGTYGLEHFSPRYLRKYVALYKREGHDEITEQLKSMVEADVPGPVLTAADMERIQVRFGTTYPSFRGEAPADTLDFYEAILHAKRPVLSGKRPTMPSEAIEDDNNDLPFDNNAHDLGMLSVEESFTQEVHEEQAKAYVE
jgi:hypothetical protein